jgi:hypothetical protein
MLNLEQILIKTAQYFDLDLNTLAIEQSVQKKRFITQSLSQKTYKKVLEKLFNEINLLKIDPRVKVIIDEFLEHYDYLQEQLRITTDKTQEKDIDWLLLKHFVIPFFAVRIGQNFANYDDRIDMGLPGGSFWYLPEFGVKKLIFPINRVMKWWIDLFGTSDEKFYKTLDQHYSDSQNTGDIKSNKQTLKKWHDNLVQPKLETIKMYASYKLDYKGVFFNDTDSFIDTQFQAALDFIKSKKISIEDLKLEVPNWNSIVDRMNSNTLTYEEKERFVLYIINRWAKPTAKKLEDLLTVSRVSQSTYKELCEYFSVDVVSNNIDENKIMQLVALFSNVYNSYLSYTENTEFEWADLFKSYIPKIDLLHRNSKDALDQIIAKILGDLNAPYNDMQVDEIVLFSNDLESRKQAKKNLEMEEEAETVDREYNIKVNEALEYLKKYRHFDNRWFPYVQALSNTKLLHNIGDFFEGKNHLTNEAPLVDITLAFTIHIQYYRVSTDILNKKVALHKIVNLATFPYYPRLIPEAETEKWFTELIKIGDASNEREQLGLRTKWACHLICQKKFDEAILLIDEYEDKTKEMKPEEYVPELLWIGKKVGLMTENSSLVKRLDKRLKMLPSKYQSRVDLSKESIFHYYK